MLSVIVKGIGTVIEKIIKIVTPIVKWLYNDIIKPIFDTITSTTMQIVTFISDYLIKPIISAVSFLWDTLTTGITTLWNGITTVLGVIVNWVKDHIIDPITKVFEGGFNIIKGIVSGVANFIKSSFETVKTAITTIFNGSY